MTTEEAIKTIEVAIAEVEWDYPMEYAVAFEKALAALRAQQEAERGCDKCNGIVYRQTNSGKIVPLEQICGTKITPPCYQPDGDGCAYQIYGDNNDEPIDRCKRCPLCYSDKSRHHQEKNEPLTLNELREMDGEPVWVECLCNQDLSRYAITERGKNGIFTRLFFADYDWYGDDWLAYRHKPKEDSDNEN